MATEKKIRPDEFGVEANDPRLIWWRGGALRRRLTTFTWPRLSRFRIRKWVSPLHRNGPKR